MLTILSPVPDTSPGAFAAPTTWNLPDSIRLGALSNGKPNTSHLLDGLLEVLTADPRFALTVRFRKASASMPAAADVLEQMAAEADLVIAATAD